MHGRTLRIILILSVALVAQSSSGMEWPPQHAALIRDAADGRLDNFSLIHASLLVTPDAGDVSQALARYRHHVQQCTGRLRSADRLARAETVFRYMHEQILTRQYREDITSVGSTLREGNFNCVTSTLIYVCLCRDMGIPAQAVALPNHVFVKLKLQPTVLIETTYPQWSVLSPNDPRINHIEHLREISDVALLGRFFYNHGITWAKQSQFSPAVRAAKLSCRFDPSDSSAHINLLATINNWALDVCMKGEFQRASQLVQHGLSISSSYKPLVANDVYVHQMWIAALRRNGDQRQADAVEKALLKRINSRRSA